MRASLIYRVAAVLLLLFAVGHTLSFVAIDPKWGIDGLIAEMRLMRFPIGGFERTYWDFYLGSGLTVGLLYAFSAVLAWQLGSLRPDTLTQLRIVVWAFPLIFAAVCAVACIHLFVIPIAFSALISLCLALAAWQASNPASR